VKPANILLSPSGRALLADFGIACALADTHDMGLTPTGIGIGTPEYMSPEQARGVVIDHRADVYALGIVLFQALTGQAPFGEGDGVQVAMQQMYAEPPTPRALNPTVPLAVEEVILKALAKEPHERFQTAAEFARALDAAAPWLNLSGRVSQYSGPQRAPAVRRAAAGGRGAGENARRVWEVDGEALTLPRETWQASGAAVGMSPRPTPGPRPPIRASYRVLVVVAVVLVVLLVVGMVAALGRGRGPRGGAAPAAAMQTPPAAMQTALPSTSPAVSATAVPALLYMADFFQLAPGDLQPGDVMQATRAIPNAQYEQQEGANGTLYQGGTAPGFGRAFGTGTLVRDAAGQRRFVLLVDRLNTFGDAQRYYDNQAGQLAEGAPVAVGEQGVAGLLAGADGRAGYRLLARDRNVVLLFASVPVQAPLAFQGYFLRLAQAVAQRGERCLFTPNLQLAPGAPALCKQL
jgi:hypothetical protein